MNFIVTVIYACFGWHVLKLHATLNTENKAITTLTIFTYYLPFYNSINCCYYCY